MFAEREVPLVTINSIAESRSEIARLKTELRAANAAVDDQPGDEG